MHERDFERSPAGRLVPTIHGASAFVPNPLPPVFDAGRIALPLARASAALGELRGACRRLTNPWLLIRPLQRLEAQTSSAMEGTHTTSDDLVLAESGIETRSEAVEVANYTRALTWAIAELKTLPISSRLLRGAHLQLLSGVGSDRGQHKLPGEFKRDQNMIGGHRIEMARFVPPPPTEAAQAMSDLEHYINRAEKPQGTALIDLALVHYQFETIHPFADGNGRVGRMLVSLMALSEGLLDMPVLYISPELEGRKDEYIDLMYAVSAVGAWEDWLSFFFDIVAESAGNTVARIDRLLRLRDDYVARATAASRSSNLLRLIDQMFDTPVMTAAKVAQTLGVTDAGARILLRQLVELGIAMESARYYPTAWVAGGIIDVSRP